ncbi:hypothetical protein LCGC14_2581890 [marine sediment metagenome]|uniref:Uncharacterized protein n=1 Tax=marine sediment metagenome TaxID=412755 RepID=A0A0F9D6X8_9ZZZZ
MIEMTKKIREGLEESKKQMRERCIIVLREQKRKLIGAFLGELEKRISKYKHINTLNDSLIDLHRKYKKLIE